MIQRRYERVRFLCKLELISQPHGERLEAHSTDISLGGVGAVLAANIEVGQLVVVGFCLKDSEDHEVTVESWGRVIHFRAEVDVNKIGIQFLQPLNVIEHAVLVKRLEGL